MNKINKIIIEPNTHNFIKLTIIDKNVLKAEEKNYDIVSILCNLPYYN